MVLVAGNSPNVTCARLALVEGRQIYLRTEWLPTSFSITTLDCPRAWACHVTKEEVEERASEWDISVEEYLLKARFHLNRQIPRSTYSLRAIGADSMRFSWTMNDKENDAALRVGLTLSEERIMAVIPKFLSSLMDVMQDLKDILDVVALRKRDAQCRAEIITNAKNIQFFLKVRQLQDLEASRKAEKTMKARRMAMQFRNAERIAVRKRIALMEAPERDMMHVELESLYMEETFPGKFSSASLTCNPPSSLGLPTPSIRAIAHDNKTLRRVGLKSSHLEPRVAHDIESPRSSLKSEQMVPPSKSPDSVIENPVRRLSEVLRNSPDHAQGHHGHVKSEPHEYEGSIRREREVAQAQLLGQQRDHYIRVPLAEEYTCVLNKPCSSQVKLPVQVDVSNRLDRGSAQADLFEDVKRSYKNGPPWPQMSSSVRPLNADKNTRPLCPASETKGMGSLQKSPTHDKGVITLESKNRAVQIVGVSGIKGPQLPGMLGHGGSRGQEGMIVLSDSEGEDIHNIAGSKDDGDSLDNEKESAMEWLSDEQEEPETGFTSGPQDKSVKVVIQDASRAFHHKNLTMTGSSKRNIPEPFLTQSKKKLKKENLINIQVEKGSSRGRTERDGDWPSNLGKRKERGHFAPEIDTGTKDIVEGKAAKQNGSWCEGQQSVQIVRTKKKQIDPDKSTGVATGKVASVAQQEDKMERKSTPNNVDKYSVKPASVFNHGSRDQWNTWIKEAKTEVTGWEAPSENRNIRNGGSNHVDDHETRSPVSTSQVKDLGNFDTPPLLRKLERTFQMCEFPKIKHEIHQTGSDTPSPRSSSGNRRRNVEKLDKHDTKLGEGSERSYMQEDLHDMTKKGRAAESVQFEVVKQERMEFVQAEEDYHESDSIEEHVFEPGEWSEDDGVRCIGETVAKVLYSSEKLRRRSQREKIGSVRPLGKGRPRLKPLGRRGPGRPPGKASHSTQLLPQGSAGRSVGRPNGRHMQSTASELKSKKGSMRVEENRELQCPVPDSDYYCFDDDRTKFHIKPNQIWALYDTCDEMPRIWVRVKKVDVRGSTFEVYATWLEPSNPSRKALDWQKVLPSPINELISQSLKTGFSISCGDFKETPGGSSIIKTLNVFSHAMQFLQKSETLVQIYPRVGELWAIYNKDVTKPDSLEKARQLKGNRDSTGFRLVVILSECGRSQAPEIEVLTKRTGFRTLWLPGYVRGPIPLKYMERFSHRVPAVKLTGKECPDLGGVDCWDIDAAAIPLCQSFVT